MTDREKVIDYLLIIRTWNEVGKAYAYDEMDKKEKTKTVEWIDDALTLLKEQEPVEPIRLENWWKCPSCSGNIVANMKYCPGCGRKVKWDEI